MASYEYTNPFSVCFTTMKIRYSEYDSSISKLNFVNKDSKVNVFINFESVLNNLSMIKDLDNKLLLQRNFQTILESEAINLCAHYKKFFRGNGLETRVFLYYTDLNSSQFKNFKYNDEFRSYYINKYLNNPRYQLLGSKTVQNMIPRLQKIMEFIPNVSFINATNIEGSLIPYIIAKQDPSYKNFIVSTDNYETQYLLQKNDFCLHYIRRIPACGAMIFNTFDNFIQYIFRDDDSINTELFNNPTFYSTLMSVVGDKNRSVEPLKGIGIKTIYKYLNNGISDGVITDKTESISMICDALPDDIKELTSDNYSCVDIMKQYSELSTQDIYSITNQIVNRFDFNSLRQLNATDYKDFPLMLPELTC